MAKVTPAEFTEKWGRRLKGSTTDMIRGANKVTVAPSVSAIAAKEKMKARLIAAIDDGTWERMLGAYGLEQWKKDFTTTGVQRISGGVDKAKDKVTKFASWLIPRVEAEQAAIADLPSTTLEDNITRMTTFIRGMASKKYKKGD